jgi:hypothetical protein
MEYLKTHARDFPQVRLALAQLAVAMQIDCFDAMADACATELYKHVLESSQQDFVTGTDKWPAIRTVYDQQATKPLSPQTIENRNSTLKALYKQMDCHRPLFDSEEGYWWLANIEQVMKAATHKPDGSLKCLNSVKTTGKAVSALCEATGNPDLKDQYRLAFAKAVETAPTKPKRELTADQIKLLYDIIAQLREQAMKLHCLQDTQRYLVLALHYGDAPGFLPQRNDMRSFRYAGPDIDSAKSNVISINEDCVQLTLTQLTKRKVADKPCKPIYVSLTERAPQLAAFLRAYQPYAAKMQPDTTSPYLLCTSRTKEPLSSSHLSTLLNHTFKGLNLGFSVPGCIAARNVSTAACAAQKNKRKLSAVELATEAEECKIRGHSRRTMEVVYN